MNQQVLDALPSGYSIAGLRISHLLGTGGFAYTYLCESIDQQGALCVLKELYPMGITRRSPDWKVLLKDDEDAIEVWNAASQNFADETRALRALKTKNIPRYLDSFAANNSYYLIQEYIEGVHLGEYRKVLINSPRKIEIIVQLLREILETLSVIHTEGLLHRDIKPSNLMLRTIDSSPVLIDFGGVRFQVGGITFNFHKRVWSPGYSSPEQISTKSLEQKPASDLYSLAATFYFLLFGVDPTDSTDRLTGKPVNNFMELHDCWPKVFLESLQRAFSIDSSSRFQTADEWLLALDGYDVSASPLKIWRVGRDPEQVDVVLTDYSDTLSRFHLEIQLYENGVLLIDHSVNGVSVLTTDRFENEERHEINGTYFLPENETNVVIDLAGNMYNLNELIDF